MLLKPPQILDTYYSNDFFQNIWLQQPLIDYCLFVDQTDKLHAEAYERHSDISDYYLFFHPFYDWCSYEEESYTYKGSVATSPEKEVYVAIQRVIPSNVMKQIYTSALDQLTTIIATQASNSKINIIGSNNDRSTFEAQTNASLAGYNTTTQRMQRSSTCSILLNNVGEGYICFKYDNEPVDVVGDNRLVTRRGVYLGTIIRTIQAV